MEDVLDAHREECRRERDLVRDKQCLACSQLFTCLQNAGKVDEFMEAEQDRGDTHSHD